MRQKLINISIKYFPFALVIAAILYATTTNAVQPPAPMSSYSVKLLGSKGHGSGTHFGNGYILTAAHVVGDAKSMRVKTDDGKMRYAKTLWSSKDYDIALLQTSPNGIGSAHLSCRLLAEGEEIHADGNPLNMEFVSTNGRISGKARATDIHKLAYITDMTTVMGMSGGGVFDGMGNLVGVTSAVAVAPMKMGASFVPSLTGFGMAVPSSAVCLLLGRGV